MNEVGALSLTGQIFTCRLIGSFSLITGKKITEFHLLGQNILYQTFFFHLSRFIVEVQLTFIDQIKSSFVPPVLDWKEGKKISKPFYFLRHSLLHKLVWDLLPLSQ